MPKPLTPEEEELIREHTAPDPEQKKSTVVKNMLLFALIFILMVFFGYLMVYWGTKLGNLGLPKPSEQSSAPYKPVPEAMPETEPQQNTEKPPQRLAGRGRDDHIIRPNVRRPRACRRMMLPR